MKHQRKLQQWPQAFAWIAMLVGSTSIVLAQNTSPTNTFDNSASTTSFVQWWGGGGAGATMTWDGTLDAAGSPDSGSVKYEASFTGLANQQFMTFFTIANRWGWDRGYVLDATTYTNYSFDIKVDASSGQRVANNDYGNLEIGLVTYVTDWGTIALPTYTIPLTATSWTHVSRPITGTEANINQVVGFYFKMWSNGGHTNTLTFNVDNVVLSKPAAAVVIPPPTVSLPKAAPGLNLFTTAASGQYGRQSIRTLGQGYSWVGAVNPVSYKIDIKDAPTAGGFQTHMFLVPAVDAPYGAGDSAVDWNCTNLIFFTIQNGGATLMYKTNQGSGNAMLWNRNPTNGAIGLIANLPATSAIGTWELKFENNTNITIISPAGASTNATITADAAALFADPLFAHFGAQPNDTANIGLSSTIGRIWTAHTADALDDSFPGPDLDTLAWGKAAADAGAIFIVPAETKYWFKWTLPASLDAYVMSRSLLNGAWHDAGLTNIIQVGSAKQVQVPAAALPSAASGYFALGKRQYSKLQVLMPGETAAPGTPSGKAGTPDPQYAMTPFNVTVNAVDATWHRVYAATNVIHITSSDASATLPADGPLTGGAATFSVTFGTAGTWTVTATDVTDGTKTPNTGSPTSAN